MTYYDLMMNPGDEVFVDEDGISTPAGARLAEELKSCYGGNASGFGNLHGEMDEDEQFWRMEAVRLTWGEDTEKSVYLPGYGTNEARVLAQRLIRSNTKDPVTFHVPVGAWSNEEREASQKLESFLTGTFRMADAERRALRPRPLDSVQRSLVWQLVVRGASILIPFVRSSPRQKIAGEGDASYDQPFVFRTPDPRQSCFLEGYFCHHIQRSMNEFYGKAYRDRIEAKDGYCQSWNCWWQDADGDVWNATVLNGGCYLVPPTNHTKTRGLTSIPVIVDSAYGSPADAWVGNSEITSLTDQYESALRNNRTNWALLNLVKAYELVLLRDSTYYGMATYSNKSLSDDQKKRVFQGRMFWQFSAEDKPIQVLQPPQLSEAIRLLQQDIQRLTEAGGLPRAAGTGVSEGATALYAQEVALHGDHKAGPISDALRRTHLEAAHLILQQIGKLGRVMKVAVPGTDQKAPYMATFKPGDLPKPGEYELHAVHNPYLVEDEFKKANTALIWTQVGRPLSAILDDVVDDPQREINLGIDQRIRTDPMVALMEVADYAEKVLKNPRAAALFRQRLAQMMAIEAQATGGGQANAPRPPMAPTAGVIPDEMGVPALPPASIEGQAIDPTTPEGQNMLGQMGAAQGGSRNGAGGY